MYKISLFFLCSWVLCSCQQENKFEKYPDFSENVVDLKKDIVNIKTSVSFGPCKVYLVDNALALCDWYSLDTGFLFFDKTDFKYLGSGGRKGQGPGEIINYKNVEIIPNSLYKKSFYVFDYSQVVLYKYNIDSLLKDRLYLPEKVIDLNVSQAFGSMCQFDDTTFICNSYKAVNSYSFVNDVVILNAKSGKMRKVGYENPKIKELGGNHTHFCFGASPRKKIYAKGYRYQDLLTLCNINGELICDVYGDRWGKNDKLKLEFFQDIQIYKDYIFASYVGGKGVVLNKYKRPRGAYAKKILVFDLEGNYIKTLDLGEEFRNFCVDEKNNRLFVSFLERDEPLAYVDLKVILE